MMYNLGDTNTELIIADLLHTILLADFAVLFFKNRNKDSILIIWEKRKRKRKRSREIRFACLCVRLFMLKSIEFYWFYACGQDKMYVRFKIIELSQISKIKMFLMQQ